MKKKRILRKIKNNLIFLSGFTAVIIGAGAAERCLPISLVAFAYFAFLVQVNEKKSLAAATTRLKNHNYKDCSSIRRRCQ